MKGFLTTTALAACLVLGGGAGASAATEAEAVVATYAELAATMYADAHAGAKALKIAVDAFLAAPTPANLAAARKAWIDARPWYQQTEGFRFGNPAVDELEGRVNAWPLDEGLIDYVDVRKYGETSEENPFYRANVVANAKLKVGKTRIDATRIDKKLIGEKLQEVGGVEANVAAGWHAVEFMLWGQDLNGTGPGAGDRPASDFDLAACTGGHCDRRRAYLAAATDLLVDDSAAMAALWRPEGKARKALLAKPAAAGLAVIFTGLGSLSYGELAGERMKLGLILHDPEEEHDCFSDNTHNSHFHDQAGMVAIWRAAYTRRDGSTFTGPSLRDYALEKAPDEARRADAAFDAATTRMSAIKATADGGRMAYDQMIAAGNAEGNALVQAGVDGLIAQARGLEGVVSRLGLKMSVGASTSLDDPSKVGK
ncbi:MAG: imelysin family protein [Siculibacillus sp.]